MKIWGRIAVFFLIVGCLVQAKTSTETESLQVEDWISAEKSDVIGNEEMLGRCLESVQKQYLPVSLPSLSARLLQPAGSLPVDFSGFDSAVRKQFRGWIDEYGIVRYTVGLYEDFWTGEIVVLDDSGWEMFRIQREKSYDPYDYQRALFDLGKKRVLDDEFSRRVFHPSKIATVVELIPLVFWNAHLEAEQEQLKQSMSIAPMSMMMASMSTCPELQMDIDSLSNGTVEVLVEWLSSIDSDTLDLFHATDLVAANWQLETNFTTTGSTNFYFNDQDTNQIARFYVTGTDYDGDLDGLTSARERYLYKTDESMFSTDGDGLGDGWEMLYGFDPFSTIGTNGALGDTDNDGYGNLEEQLNDTDPHAPNGNSTTGTVATIRYYYDEDDRLTDFFVGSEVAQKTILTVAHNISEEVSAK